MLITVTFIGSTFKLFRIFIIIIIFFIIIITGIKVFTFTIILPSSHHQCLSSRLSLLYENEIQRLSEEF